IRWGSAPLPRNRYWLVGSTTTRGLVGWITGLCPRTNHPQRPSKTVSPRIRSSSPIAEFRVRFNSPNTSGLSSDSRNTTPEGHIIQNDPIFTALPIRIDFKDVLDGRLEAVAETIDEAAQEGLNTILP